MAEFECALTGKVVESEEGDSFPLGWTKISITRRQMNPRWGMLMQVQQALIEGAMAQVPAEVADIQRLVISSQVEAQFHGLMKDTPSFVEDVQDEIYICDSAEITDTLNEIREMLGLKAMPAVDQDEDEESEEAKSEE